MFKYLFVSFVALNAIILKRPHDLIKLRNQRGLMIPQRNWYLENKIKEGIYEGFFTPVVDIFDNVGLEQYKEENWTYCDNIYTQNMYEFIDLGKCSVSKDHKNCKYGRMIYYTPEDLLASFNFTNT